MASVFLEGSLIEKLRKLEALHAGTKVDGEREAARRAAERIRERIEELRGREEDVELVYRLPDPWTRRLFVYPFDEPRRPPSAGRADQPRVSSVSARKRFASRSARTSSRVEVFDQRSGASSRS